MTAEDICKQFDHSLKIRAFCLFCIFCNLLNRDFKGCMVELSQEITAANTDEWRWLKIQKDRVEIYTPDILI